MDFVVNEWLPEYFRPTATAAEKRLLQTFLQRFLERGDRLVVLEASPFLEKIYRYAKAFQLDYNTVNPIRDFIKLILLDSERCVFVAKSNQFDLPDSVFEKLLITNLSSDTYLFETATAIKNIKVIVTTDIKLHQHFEHEDWCRVQLLPDFLVDY